MYIPQKLADEAQQAFSSDEGPSMHPAIPALEALHFQRPLAQASSGQRRSTSGMAMQEDEDFEDLSHDAVAAITPPEKPHEAYIIPGADAVKTQHKPQFSVLIPAVTQSRDRPKRNMRESNPHIRWTICPYFGSAHSYNQDLATLTVLTHLSFMNVYEDFTSTLEQILLLWQQSVKQMQCELTPRKAPI
ncbi:hypothetical protein B0H14DRAFT_3580481 [Mycena olivaceomarginata]|nr:hypothetical protein B0H14DRAFT_3580481 [Mycena olivaceomarginata]